MELDSSQFGAEPEELDARLILSVAGYEKNKDRLAEFPYIRYGEIVLLAQICVGEKENDKYPSCIPISKEMLGEWSFSEEDLFKKACENSKKLMPGVLRPLDEYTSLSENLLHPDGNAVPSVYVLTNALHFNGAAALFYQPDLLTSLGEQLNKSVFALFPTGRNEIYCIALDSKDLVREYQELLDEFSKEQPETDECIAKKVVCFDIHRRRLEQMDGVSYPIDLSLKEETKGIHTVHSHAR